MTLTPEQVDAVKLAGRNGVLALANNGRAPMTIQCVDGTTLELKPGEWCEIAWGDKGKFDRIISGPHRVPDQETSS